MEVHIDCLIEACKTLDIDFSFLDKDKNFLHVPIAGGLYFQLNKTPFNSEVMAGICKDKEHTYRLFHSSIAMPKTLGFLDYATAEAYRKYLSYRSKEAVIAKIEKEFSYPLVVKPNQGALGVNVFLCGSRQDVANALDAIFNRRSPRYDYVAIAQEYIVASREFRVVLFWDEPVLVYERRSASNRFGARYWEFDDGVAAAIDDPELLAAIQDRFGGALSIPGLGFVGLDLILTHDGEFMLLELNSAPKFDHYLAANGKEPLIAMYAKILSRVRERSEHAVG